MIRSYLKRKSFQYAREELAKACILVLCVFDIAEWPESDNLTCIGIFYSILKSPIHGVEGLSRRNKRYSTSHPQERAVDRFLCFWGPHVMWKGRGEGTIYISERWRRKEVHTWVGSRIPKKKDNCCHFWDRERSQHALVGWRVLREHGCTGSRKGEHQLGASVPEQRVLSDQGASYAVLWCHRPSKSCCQAENHIS